MKDASGRSQMFTLCLSQSRWIGAELSAVAAQELAPYAEEARVRIDGPQVLLEPGTAQAIAVVLHELATNAAKYGALSTAKGRVALKWSHEADGQPPPPLDGDGQPSGDGTHASRLRRAGH